MNSSMMLSLVFTVRRSLVWSNWKSIAQMTLGAMGRMAPITTPSPPQTLLLLAIGDFEALLAPQTLDPLVVHVPTGVRSAS